jgi:predicted alpha/beta superfamily hydrolase
MRLQLTTPAQDDRPVFVTGNFCDWATNVPELQLQPTGNGYYIIDLPVDENWPETVEYKYDRGDGGSFELNEVGEGVPNRSIPRDTDFQDDYVPFWAWGGVPYRPHWLPAYVELPFEYPDKDEPRRVRLLLPADYEASDKRYPVLYLNDGQNAIGAGEGFGSWNVEERMAMLASRSHHELIIVAIDHGGESRIREFVVGEVDADEIQEVGRGEEYIAFLTDTVKPHIDANYRTRPEAKYTGIGGSSMGGLISIYGGLLRPDVFGRWLIFSPSLWIAPDIYALATQTYLPDYAKIYLYGGAAESASLLGDMHRLRDTLCRQEGGCDQIEMAVNPEGKHEEGRWSREFARAVDYLFFNYLEVEVSV